MTWWSDLPEKVRKWTGLVSVVVMLVGGSAAITAATVRGADEMTAIPKRVDIVEHRLDSLDFRQTIQMDMVRDSIRGLSEDVKQTRCMVRGLVLDDEDPRDCIFADDGR